MGEFPEPKLVMMRRCLELVHAVLPSACTNSALTTPQEFPLATLHRPSALACAEASPSALRPASHETTSLSGVPSQFSSMLLPGRS